MRDKELRQNVTDALEFEPSLDAANIGVAVDDSIVTLSGHVPTYAEKATAERIAARVRGVRGIAQEIEVRPVGAHLTADDEIAKRAANILHWNTSIPTDAVKLTVSNGVLTLEGEVEWHYQSAAAEKMVQGIAGVTGITNRIMVKPVQPSPFDVHQRIESALRRDAELDARNIRIAVSDGTVTLEGKVDSYGDRRIAERAAWGAPGVHHVDDRLTVG